MLLRGEKNNIYVLLLIPAILGILAIQVFGFFFKSGTAGTGILILYIYFIKTFRRLKIY